MANNSFWGNAFARPVGEAALRGDPRALPVLQRIAGPNTSGGFQNVSADYLNRLGVPTEYANPNRKQNLGTLGNIARVAGLGAGALALGLGGGALLGGGAASAGGAAGAAKAAGPSFLSRIGSGLGIIGPNGRLNPLRLAQLGLGAAGVIQGAGAQGRANKALGRAVAPVNVPMPDLSPVFADPHNPYAQQSGPNGAQLAAIRALQSR